MRNAFRVGLCLFFAWSAVVACEGDPPTPKCTNIPQGGCPRIAPNVCDDPSCVSIYSCTEESTWHYEYDCPAGPAIEDAGSEASTQDAHSDVAMDVEVPAGGFGGAGCPDLELPECPAGNAILCGPTCCGCTDLFVCREATWVLWGTCGDGGVVTN